MPANSSVAKELLPYYASVLHGEVPAWDDPRREDEAGDEGMDEEDWQVTRGRRRRKGETGRGLGGVGKGEVASGLGGGGKGRPPLVPFFIAPMFVRLTCVLMISRPK